MLGVSCDQATGSADTWRIVQTERDGFHAGHYLVVVYDDPGLRGVEVDLGSRLAHQLELDVPTDHPLPVLQNVDAHPQSREAKNVVGVAMNGPSSLMVSRPEELHPRPLVELCVRLSPHTAPIRRTRRQSPFASVRIDADSSSRSPRGRHSPASGDLQGVCISAWPTPPVIG